MHDFTTIKVYCIFTVFINFLFHVDLKHSGFGTSADDKPMQNDLVYTVP